MQPIRVVLCVSLVSLALGCGDKPPTGPSQAGPTVTGLAIGGADAVLTGLSASYTATVSLSDGTTKTVTPTWTSSDPRVGTVDSAGRLDGRTHGSTTLSATYLGRDASKTVRVVNNYAGNWTGRYVIRACADTGDLTDRDGGWCANGPGRVGTVARLGLEIVQNGTTPSEVTAVFGSYTCGTFSGLVSADGRLTLAGTLPTGDEFDWYCEHGLGTLRVGPWNTTLDGTGGMTGTWSQLETYTGSSFRKGTLQTENELIAMTRTSTSAMPAATSR